MGRRAGKSRGRGNCSRDVMYERGIKEKNDILLPGVTEHPAKKTSAPTGHLERPHVLTTKFKLYPHWPALMRYHQLN